MKFSNIIKFKEIVLVFAGVISGALIMSSAKPSSEALFGLLGVLIGAFIPSVFQSWGARLDRRNQLRLAAIEKRLEVHQRAYSLWTELRSKAHDSKNIGQFVMVCQKWWDENCLYLEPKARKAFKHAYICANNHKDFLNERQFLIANNRKINEINKIIRENWEDISKAGPAIVEGIELPTIGEEETKTIGVNEYGEG